MARSIIALANWGLVANPTVVGSKMSRGVDILQRRWVVERTFAWLTKCRRLAKDYEFLPQSGETMIYPRMIQIMIKRLGKTKPKTPA